MIMLNTSLLGVSIGATTTTTTTPTTNPTTPTTPTTTPTTDTTAPATMAPTTPADTPSGSTSGNNQATTVTVQPAKERTTIMAGQFYKPTASSRIGVVVINLIATPQEDVVIFAPVSFDTTVPPENWTPRQMAIADFVKEYPILI